MKKRCLYFLILILSMVMFACQHTNKCSNIREESCFIEPDSLFSKEVIDEIKRITFSNKLYSIYTKSYSNTTSLFIYQEDYVDTTRLNVVDYICLYNESVYFIYSGMSSLKQKPLKYDCFQTMKEMGLRFEWDGKIEHNNADVIHIRNGSIIKTDTNVVADQNILYLDEVRFTSTPFTRTCRPCAVKQTIQ